MESDHPERTPVLEVLEFCSFEKNTGKFISRLKSGNLDFSDRFLKILALRWPLVVVVVIAVVGSR